MIILHAGYNEGFVPNARKKHFITYKIYFPILKKLKINKIARKKNKFELTLEPMTSHVSGESFNHCTNETDIN